MDKCSWKEEDTGLAVALALEEKKAPSGEKTKF